MKRTPQTNLDILSTIAQNDFKAIYRSTITVSGTIQTLATDIAAIAAAGKGSPKAITISVVSSETSGVVARYTLEGTDPVATTTGEPLYNKSKELITEFYNIQRFRIVQEGAYTTTVEVTYFK